MRIDICQCLDHWQSIMSFFESSENLCMRAQSCLTLQPQISQASILEWVAISYSRDLPNPGMEPSSLASPALVGRFFTTVSLGKPNSIQTSKQLGEY